MARRPSKKSPTHLPGAALLAEYIERNNLSRQEIADRTADCRTKVDRVTVVHLLSDRPEKAAKRVSVGVALAIEHATHGEVPASSWEPVEIESPPENEPGERVSATGSER